jgi:hypothetical protein
MIRLCDLKAGDRLVAGEGHMSFAPGQLVEVARVQRGDVLVPGEAEDGNDAVIAEMDAFVAQGKFGPCILAVRSDGGTGRHWVRNQARHRRDNQLTQEDLTLSGFSRAAGEVAAVQPARGKARRA